MRLAQSIDLQVAHSAGLATFAMSLVGVFGYLPIVITCVAGVLAAGSYAVTFWESTTIQRWVSRRSLRRRQKKIEKLRRKQLILTARLQSLDVIDEANATAKQMMTDAHQANVTSRKVAADAAMSTPPTKPLAASASSVGPTGTR